MNGFNYLGVLRCSIYLETVSRITARGPKEKANKGSGIRVVNAMTIEAGRIHEGQSLALEEVFGMLRYSS